jgi:hypothetical protein
MKDDSENFRESSMVPGTGEDEGYMVSIDTYPSGHTPSGAWTSTVWVKGTGEDEGYLVSREVVTGWDDD